MAGYGEDYGEGYGEGGPPPAPPGRLPGPYTVERLKQHRDQWVVPKNG